ncbi:hypothetical protein V2J09_013488, partial [Rumex salicifolius]
KNLEIDIYSTCALPHTSLLFSLSSSPQALFPHSTFGFSSTVAMNSSWLRAAMFDDNLVAEFLLLLNLPNSSRSKPSPPLPPLDWGIRQPRSKAAASLTKELDSRRLSPTTPLSWIASASPSDSFEESSLQLVSAVRFKGFATTDFTNSVGSSTIPRRKRVIKSLPSFPMLYIITWHVNF